MTATKARFGLDRLDASERASLAMDIWESLEDDRPSSDWTDEQRRTILRRDAELDSNPGLAVTWAEIRSSVVRGS
jgi:putative addiction module component (TIGR02574 family)